MGEQSGDVGTTEQRMGRLLLLSGFQQKKHGHHHHGHMMMPGQPAANLVVIHPGCCLGIPEGPFNKISLPLHVSDTLAVFIDEGSFIAD